MVTKQDKATITEYQGSALTTPIEYDFSWEEFEATGDGIAAAKAAGEWPNEGGILKGINNARKIAARQKIYVEKTKTLREAYESTRAFKVSNLAKALEASGKSKSEALQLAEQLTPAE